MTGLNLSDFQKEKWDKHSELLSGENISLHNGNFNASFDHIGSGHLSDLVRFAVSYGVRAR